MRFWQELKLDLAKKGAWGVMVVVVGLVILGLGAKLGITVK
jgi:tetrahydromethanopterin S-methyltransferase subunit E